MSTTSSGRAFPVADTCHVPAGDWAEKVIGKWPGDAVWHALLPALALAAGGMAEVARQVRGSLLDILSSQFVRTLKAKGLKSSTILWRHGVKNIGHDPGLLVNAVDRAYDYERPDHYRLPADSPHVPFDILRGI